MNHSKISSVMRRIAAGTISRDEAADELGCSARTVNRIMKERGVERPPSPIHEQRTLAKGRREQKRVATELFLAQAVSIEEACELAEMTKRSLYRWKNRLQKA